MIDILGLLEEKTRGNLTVEERQLLEQGLYELRMRFMDVKNGAPAHHRSVTGVVGADAPASTIAGLKPRLHNPT